MNRDKSFREIAGDQFSVVATTIVYVAFLLALTAGCTWLVKVVWTWALS